MHTHVHTHNVYTHTHVRTHAMSWYTVFEQLMVSYMLSSAIISNILPGISVLTCIYVH